MTRAQELYNDFLTLGWKCNWCSKHFKFSEVAKWGDKEGGATNVTCPYCQMSLRMDLPEIVTKIEQLGNLDKKIIKILVEYADEGGVFNEHSPYNIIYHKCIMILKHNPLFTSLIHIRPLPYVERMTMIQIYRELVEGGKIQEVDVYEVQAPIPVVSERLKVKTIKYGKTTQAYEKSKGEKKKTKPKGAQMSFMMGGSKSKPKAEVSELTPEPSIDMDDALAAMLGISNDKLDKPDKVEVSSKVDLSELDDMMKELEGL